jgi:5-methylcytosine-specific restriction endonuclease McrA
MKEEILRLRALGYSYSQIQKETGASKGTISYHCSGEGKSKALERQRNRRKSVPLTKKIDNFKGRSRKALRDSTRDFQRNRTAGGRHSTGRVYDFSVEDLLNKIGLSPICAITGRQIDLSDPLSYSLDHIVPVSSGGDGSLENLQIVSRQANMMKNKYSMDEVIQFAVDVLKHHGIELDMRE